MLKAIEDKILRGDAILYSEAVMLLEDSIALEALMASANRIRIERAGHKLALCSIINGKNGQCSEDCKFCAQSVHYETGVDVYEQMPIDKIVETAKSLEKEGVKRFSIVTSGRSLHPQDMSWLLEAYRALKRETELELCASHGMLTLEQAKVLKAIGVTTYHHNLETSRSHYADVCTTHSYEARIETIKNCQRAGLKVCSGGIFGIDETDVDRIDMAFELKKLEIKSVPINFLMPISGTPMALNELPSPERILRMLAIYRMILPDAEIRFAGGRAYLGELVKRGFQGGVNGALSGNYLTTVGNTIAQDMALIRSLGFEV
ncbi:biotin synthase BioB [Fusibacter ferrireducens]|uniref:Biotin synthase n=1 Tax=Fusibacter ferrireducens TaxID=2785058 RepID=A0ABS0A0C8_9FIRM|nr:biotin synthase BioB [Fusibacter ferrireducens]MBF4695344.1 biotin synthase BioB [Fusibacter ferrireducens]